MPAASDENPPKGVSSKNICVYSMYASVDPVVRLNEWLQRRDQMTNQARKGKNPGRPSIRNRFPTCSREYPLSMRKSSHLRSHFATFPILSRTIISLGPLRFPPPWTALKFVNLRITSHSSIWVDPCFRRFLSKRQVKGLRRRSASSTFTAPLGWANLTSSRPLFSLSSKRAAVLCISRTVVLL